MLNILLNKVDIFVFSSHKKYFRSFIKFILNHWCYLDYFNGVLITLTFILFQLMNIFMILVLTFTFIY